MLLCFEKNLKKLENVLNIWKFEKIFNKISKKIKEFVVFVLLNDSAASEVDRHRHIGTWWVKYLNSVSS